MDILLIVATLVVAAAGLYVAVTFNRRTRANFTPMIDAAVKDVTEQIDTIAEDLRGRLRVIADDLQRDRDQARLDARKVQGRLDHADSRLTTVANQLQSEVEAVRRLSDQLGVRQLPGSRPGE